MFLEQGSVFGPVNSRVLVVNDVIFLLQTEIHAVNNGGRVDVVVAGVFRIDERVPRVVNNREENVAFDERINEVPEAEHGRKVPNKAHKRTVIHGRQHGPDNSFPLFLLDEENEGAGVRRIRHPLRNVSDPARELVPGTVRSGVYVVLVVIVLVVVVDMGDGEHSGDDTVEHSYPMVEHAAEKLVHDTPLEERTVDRVTLLVAHHIDPHKVRVHRANAEKVEGQTALVIEPSREGQVELVEE
mmetsp:Transcript_1291/g.2211  ORF Transcript_1291/g.2211 Transcript_1291/m.2211 type:complete len:242 (+) Transcript_1291:361-1086(+)